MNFVFYPRTGPGKVSPVNYGLLFWRNLAFAGLLLLSLASAPAKAQSGTLTVGTGTSQISTFPMNTGYSYTYSQSTYLAGELLAAGATPGTPGYISSISYNLKNYSSDWLGTCEDWIIYMGNTSKSTFSSTTDWVPSSSLTEVFNGTVFPGKAGWVTITFPEPFYWDGTSNLVVAVEEDTYGFGAVMRWEYTGRTGRRSITYYSDEINPGSVNPPYDPGLDFFEDLSGTPNIKLAFAPADPCTGAVTSGSIVANPAHLCTRGDRATLATKGGTLASDLSYEWYAASSPWDEFTAVGTGLSYTTDPLKSSTWFRVVVTCKTSGAKDTSEAFKVTVGALPVPYSEDFESGRPGVKPTCSESTHLWGNENFWNLMNNSYSTAANHTPGGRKYLIAGFYLGYDSEPDFAYIRTDDNYWFTPAIALDAAYRYELSFWYNTSKSSGNKIGVFYGNSQSSGAMLHTVIPMTAVKGVAYKQLSRQFTPPASGTYYFGFKKTSSSDYAYPGVAIDDIKLKYAPCNGMPLAGTISGDVASGTALCAHTSVRLTSIGATVNQVPGIIYQWMRRSTGLAGSWSAVAGATDSVLKADSLVGFEYRLRVVCSNTKDTAYSSIFQLPALPAHPPVVITPATSPVSYCPGDTVRFNATGYTSGVYDWMIDGEVRYGWKFSDMGATEPGEYMVRVTSPLSPCPAYSNKVKLNINDPGYSVAISTPADSIICEGSSILLTAVAGKPGVTIRWRRDNIDIPFATGSSYLAAASGYYRAVASDGSSPCPAVSRNVPIIVKPKPEAKITVPGDTLTACEREGLVLKASPGYSYEWLRGGSAISGAVDDSLVVKNSGMYSVKVRAADACVNISVPVSVTILASPEPVIMKRMPVSGSVELSTGVFASYQWYRNGVKMPGATTQTISATLNGLYKVMVRGINDCEGISDPIEINESTLSIGDPGLQAGQIRIYPNPTQSKVFIESPVAVQVSVTDITGRAVLQSQEVKEVDLGKYADGVYLFTISDKEGKELIKQQRVAKFTR